MDNIIEGVKSSAVKIMVYILLAAITTFFYSWASMNRIANNRRKLARQMKVERQKIYKKVKIKKRKIKGGTKTSVDKNNAGINE